MKFRRVDIHVAFGAHLYSQRAQIPTALVLDFDELDCPP